MDLLEHLVDVVMVRVEVLGPFFVLSDPLALLFDSPFLLTEQLLSDAFVSGRN